MMKRSLLVPSSSSSSFPSFVGSHFQSLKKKMSMLQYSSLISSNNSSIFSLCTHSSSKLKNIDDALEPFDHMLHWNPLPSIVQLNKLLLAVVSMKKYETVVSLSRQMEFASVTCTMCILDSLFWQKSLTWVFCLMLSHFDTLLNGLIKKDKVDRAMILYHDMLKGVCRLDLYPYSVTINGFCKIGKIDSSVELFKKMEEIVCEPNEVTYNTSFVSFL